MFLICFAAAPATVALSALQENSANSKKGESKKTEERRPEDPQPAPINLHVAVSVDGLKPLPEESSIQLKGLDDCDNLTRHGSLDPEGQTTFSGVPVCKVMVKILITGLDAKIVPSVDLAGYRNAPLRIQVKSSGPPIVN